MDLSLEGEYYAVVTLVVTTAIIYYGRNWSFRSLAFCQYLPTVFALLFSWYDGSLQTLTRRALLLDQNYQVVGYHIMCGFFTAVVSIALITELVIFFGWGIIAPSHKGGSIFGSNTFRSYNILLGSSRAFGEEFGWRCFLMPVLLAKYDAMTALFISGIIWALFHIPIMMLLTTRCKVKRPITTCVFQAVSIFLDAYVFGWLAIKTKYSLWASGFCHTVWNLINPIVLGSVYTNTDGIIKGEIWKINGEGLGGCIFGLIAVYFIRVNLNA